MFALSISSNERMLTLLRVYKGIVILLCVSERSSRVFISSVSASVSMTHRYRGRGDHYYIIFSVIICIYIVD